jgi:hypothetical protein
MVVGHCVEAHGHERQPRLLPALIVQAVLIRQHREALKIDFVAGLDTVRAAPRSIFSVPLRQDFRARAQPPSQSGEKAHLRLQTEDEYKIYHRSILTARERERFRAGAVQVLEDFAAKAIQAERTDLLKHPSEVSLLWRFRGDWGAFFWTVLLVVITILAKRAGIDLLEIYERAAGCAGAY